MAISLDSLPTNNNGIVDGSWTIQLRQNLNGGHAGVEFRDGRSVTPLDGNALRRFVSAMSQDIVGAYRSSDNTAIGDVSTLRPESFDEAHSKSLQAQSSNKLLEETKVIAEVGKENEHTDAIHAAAGAKFISPEELENRKEFEKASGREVVEESGGATVTSAGSDGGTVKTGGEPVDPSTLPDGDPLKPVPVEGAATIGKVNVTVDTGATKETFTGDVKSNDPKVNDTRTSTDVKPATATPAVKTPSYSTELGKTSDKPGTTDKSKK